MQNFNAPIRGFASGDIISLEGFGKFATINGISAKYNSSSNATSVTLTDNGSTVATLNLAGGNYTSATVTANPVVTGAIDITLPGGAPPAPVISGLSDPIASVAVTGAAQSGDLVSLFDGTTLLGTATAGANGAWSLSVATTALQQGTDSLTATDENPAGITSVQYNHVIPGRDTSRIRVSSTLTAPLVFGDGNNVVADVSQLYTLDFGNGNNVVSSTGQSKSLIFGSGTDQVGVNSTAVGSWQQNQVSIDGSSAVNVAGNWNQVTVGSGAGGTTVFNGSNNFFETLETGGYTASDTQGSSSDEFYLYGGDANLMLAGTGDMALVSRATIANITDDGSGLQLYVAGDAGDMIINGWANDPNAGIELMNYSGYQTAQAAFDALVSDGHGGTLLPLLNSGTSIDFANTASGSIHPDQLAVPSSWSGGYSGGG